LALDTVLGLLLELLKQSTLASIQCPGIRCLDYKNVAMVNNPLVYWPSFTGGATDPWSY